MDSESRRRIEMLKRGRRTWPSPEDASGKLLPDTPQIHFHPDTDIPQKLPTYKIHERLPPEVKNEVILDNTKSLEPEDDKEKVIYVA